MSATLVETVSATVDPKKNAPQNSKIDAKMTACHGFRVLDPMLAAKEFA